ncbi:MAG TPA: S1 RNA-binding domain-containing protein [Phycisphaerales bacterium]|nr:S1 RNA-binding domain-containing protein [Phycisphaerales bacterium]HMP38658.1 S1 RNA-binding domain-containing protein [Phycisphaerales bacterium]
MNSSSDPRSSPAAAAPESPGPESAAPLHAGSAPLDAAPAASAAPRPAGRPALDTALEAEIDAALGDMSVEDLLDTPAPRRPAAAGDRGTIHREFRTGTVVRVRGDDVLVEFGPKASGVCPLSQFEEAPPPGTHIEFVVERFDQKEGLLILSREGAVQKASWEALAVGQVVEATCTGMNKGGLEFEIAHHRAFMPAGQVDLRHIKDISVFLGQKLPCEIMQLDRQRGRVVLSRKAVLEKERRRNAERTLGELEVGQERDATITSVQPYGAFADLGGVDGLIHVADLSHERNVRTSDLVKEGQVVRVRILRIDRNAEPPRIGLGLKQLTADPSIAAFNELAPGATVNGRVTKLMAFGAFVEIAPGVEGLVHISEISHERIASVESALKRDEIVTAKILAIDTDRKRVSLSIKQLQDRPEPAAGRGGRDRRDDAERLRDDDPAMRKLRAKFGTASGLKGGIA